jgi:hypothetical protein
MINHARTLLLNIPHDESNLPGKEIIEPDFRPIALPGQLQRVRALLFGENPDQAMLFYRGQQLMSLLHATELETWITALDTRITYSPFDKSLLNDPRFGIRVRAYKAHSDSKVTTARVVGDREPEVFGRLQFEWQVEINNTAATIRSYHPTTTRELPLNYNGGQSAFLPLSGSKMKFSVADPGAMDEGEEARLRISALLRPAQPLSGLQVSLPNLGDETLSYLFGLTDEVGKKEPFPKLYDLFTKSNIYPLKLSAVVLALIYRTESLRL